MGVYPFTSRNLQIRITTRFAPNHAQPTRSGSVLQHLLRAMSFKGAERGSCRAGVGPKRLECRANSAASSLAIGTIVVGRCCPVAEACRAIGKDDLLS